MAGQSGRLSGNIVRLRVDAARPSHRAVLCKACLLAQCAQLASCDAGEGARQYCGNHDRRESE